MRIEEHCHEIAGFIELKNELGITRIFCRTQYHIDFQAILPILRQVLEYHDIEMPYVNGTNQYVMAEGIEIRFVPEHLFGMRTKGMDNFAVVDMMK